MDNQLQKTDFSLENIITAAVKIPGVKVSRSDFLESIFRKGKCEHSGCCEFGTDRSKCSAREAVVFGK